MKFSLKLAMCLFIPMVVGVGLVLPEPAEIPAAEVSQVPTTYRYDDLSPVFKITGIDLQGNTVWIRGLEGEYGHNMEILNVTPDGENRFIITFKVTHISEMVRAQILDLNSSTFAAVAWRKAYDAFHNDHQVSTGIFTKGGKKQIKVRHTLTSINFLRISS
ncbi:MAG TPA: hypothetical protein VJC04_02800 [Candidatus Paceibacterota bacterium]